MTPDERSITSEITFPEPYRGCVKWRKTDPQNTVFMSDSHGRDLRIVCYLDYFDMEVLAAAMDDHPDLDGIELETSFLTELRSALEDDTRPNRIRRLRMMLKEAAAMIDAYDRE